VFNQMTTGAGNDIERVSEIARRMVCEWGMSEAVGPLTFRAANPLGGQPAQIMSEHTAQLIDAEVKKVVQTAYDRARDILATHRHHLDGITQALLDQETISGADIRRIIEES
jgi:cell division protease FtsH